MSRTRITTTDDTSSPRTVWLGSGIIWYAYIRPPNQTLYIQRSEAGVLDTEIAITSPVPNFDVIKDPATPDVGWIYFVHDGAVEKLMVTPLGAVLTSVAYLRQDGWYQAVPAVGGGTGLFRQFTVTEFPPLKELETETIWEGTQGPGGSFLLHSWTASEGPDAPTIALERTTLDLNINVTLPSLLTFRNRNLTQLKVYKLDDFNTGWEYYSTVSVPDTPEAWEPPLPALRILIPFTVAPITYWYVTCVRTGYLPSESAQSNIVYDDGTLPIIYLEIPLSGGGAGLLRQFDTTEYLPDKTLVTDPPTETIGADGNGLGGAGLLKQWVVNGTNILNP